MPPVKRYVDQNELRKTADYPHAEWPFEEFNPLQSRVMETYDHDASCLIAAATSAGKTVCAEAYLAHEIRVRGGKGMYLGPLKALTQEKIDDWTNENHHFKDLKISICTGDYRLTASRKKELANADLIIMTTEMLNCRCRNYKSENNDWLKEVKTIVVDESHLLTVPGRGDHLEAGLMKFSEISPNSRIVMLSATMPNVKQIAEWVSYSLTKNDTDMIESTFRPCKLNVHYERYWDGARSYQDNELSKVGSAVQIVNDYPDDKFLVFVHTKNTGEMVKRALKRDGIEAEFHNADLTKEKRIDLQNRFKDKGDLRCIIATSTLAWGCHKHGDRVLMGNGSLKDVSLVKEGDTLLSQVDGKYLPKKVLGSRTFNEDSGWFLKLESGEKMTVSEDHLFYSAIGRNSPCWNKVSDIKKGDFVAVPKNLNIWSKSSFSDFWYLIGFSFGDGSLCFAGNHADGEDKISLNLCMGEKTDHIPFVKGVFFKEFGVNLSLSCNKDDVNYFQTKKRSVVDKFSKILPIGRRDGSHDIPKEVYENSERVSCFLSGWFDADGGMEDHGNGNLSVGLSCISEKAIESCKSLLLGYGIRSSCGKKKNKDRIINGRKQKAKREWIYRLRIYGYENVVAFNEFIGFKHPDKDERLKEYIKSIDENKFSKDLIPARDLLLDHIKENDMKPKDFREISGTDLWNAVNKSDCNRKTVDKFLKNTEKRSSLNDLFDSPIGWSRVEEVCLCEGGDFREIEVESPHNYVGCGAISHNCNLPARRVIVTGVHRGLSEVANYDVLQMIGRAGRVGLDPMGDAYILLPESKFDEWSERLQVPEDIQSQMLDKAPGGHHKVLAFHIVSEIHHGGIQTMEGVHDWYERSLAHFQNKELDEEVVDNVMNLLSMCGAIKVEDNKFKCTSVGKIASMFYYSPFDIADLRKSLTGVFNSGNEINDLWVSMALGNIDSHKMGIVSKAEREEMSQYAGLIGRIFGPKVMEPAIKAGFAYFNLLNGRSSKSFAALQRSIQQDYPRMSEVLMALDTMSCRWGKKDFFKKIRTRMVYGIEEHLVGLCGIPNVGKVRATKLYKAGLTSPEMIVANPEIVKKSLNMKDDAIKKIVADASKAIASG